MKLNCWFSFAVIYLGIAYSPALSFSPPPRPASDVTALSFSPDGRFLASGGWDGRVFIWDTATAKRTAKLPECSDPISALKYSPDGTLLAVSGWKRMRLWNTKDWGVHRLFTTEPYGMDVSFSPDGKSIAVASASADIWDIDTGKLQAIVDIDSLCIEYVNDDLVVSGGWDGHMVVWSIANQKPFLCIQVNEFDLRDVTVSKDKRMCACGGWSDTATVWDISTGKKILAAKVGEPGSLPVCFTSDSRQLLVGSTEGVVKLVDISSGKAIRELKNGKSCIETIACSSDGKTIAAGHNDGSIRIWDLATGKMLHKLQAHSERLWKRTRVKK